MVTKPKTTPRTAVKAAVSPKPTAVKKPAAIAVAKAPAAKVAMLKPAPLQAVAAAPAVKPAPSGDSLKKKDLIDKVVETTGAKKALVRDIIEATLNVLGDALSKGVMLNLPPFGKAKVSRASDAGSGKPMTVKLRRMQSGGAKPAGGKQKQALADAED